MDDMNAFERQVAGEIIRAAAPARPVDAAAVFAAIPNTTQSPRWRFHSMFSATKIVAAGAIVALFGGFLLAGVITQPTDEQMPAIGASASPSMQAVGDDAYALFTAESFYGDDDVTVDEMTRRTTIIMGVTATDERASGVLEHLFEGDMHPFAGGRSVHVDGIQYNVPKADVRLINDGGSWVGTMTGVYAWPLERSASPPRSIPTDGVVATAAPATDPEADEDVATGLYELTGQGGYEGLTMYLTDGEWDLVGVIVPSESVPGLPAE